MAEMTEREKYLKYHASPKAIKDRGLRVMARRKMVDKHGSAALVGKDVHHKVSPANGGTNADSNLAVKSTKWNRGVGKK